MKSKRIQIEKMKKKSNCRCNSCQLVRMKIKRLSRGSRVPSLAAITRSKSIMGWKVTPTTTQHSRKRTCIWSPSCWITSRWSWVLQSRAHNITIAWTIPTRESSLKARGCQGMDEHLHRTMNWCTCNKKPDRSTLMQPKINHPSRRTPCTVLRNFKIKCQRNMKTNSKL